MGTQIIKCYNTRLWTPTEISEALWLDAADSSTITTVSSSRISQWNDKSGNNRHAISPLPSISPVYISGQLNGLPIVRFSNTIELESPFLTPSALTVYVVYKRNGSPANGSNNVAFVLEIGQKVITNNTGRILQASYNDSVFSTALRAGNTGASSVTYPRNNNWNIHHSSAVFNPTTGYGTYALNGSSSTSTPLTASALVNQGTPVVRVGAGHTWFTNSIAPNNFGLIGDIAEIIIFDSILSTDTIDRINGYLAHKWGLVANLPLNHPYKNNPPYV